MSIGRIPQVALYLLDQDRETTSSLGILNYTRNLILGMVEVDDPGFVVSLWVSRSNYDDFVPAQLPGWMRVVCVEGCYGTGWRRLAADHVIAVRLAFRHRPGLIHFPKGFLPLWLPRSIQCVVTIHDTIVSYYREHYPGYFPRLKTGYFQFLLRRAYRQAAQVITVSQFSAQSLTQELGSLSRLHVIPSAGFCPRVSLPEANVREGIFVIGSLLPHKATAETISLLDTFARETGYSEPVTISGIKQLEEISGYRAPRNLKIQLVGRLPFCELQDQIARSRALVVLSEIEGFGLPLLEAYAVGTPVCFRNVASMREVLEGMPGGWDGMNEKSFFTAMDQCLSMTPDVLSTIQQKLALRYNWRQSVEDTLDVYRKSLTGNE